MEKKEPKLLPDIEKYLESVNYNLPISISNLTEIYQAISAKIGISEDTSKIILRLFFEEIRNYLLKGFIIDIRKFGRFYISSPKISKNSKKIFLKFKAKKSLIKELNNK